MTTTDASAPQQRRLFGAFALAVAASFVLPLVPGGRYLLYPFALIATWAHEMGHGLMGVLVGSFEKLVLLPDLGGYAVVRRESGWEAVAVSAAGLLGPALVGAALIYFGARPKSASRSLQVLSGAILFSVVVWIRNGFGFFAMLAIGLVLLGISVKAPAVMREVLTAFIGVQLCMASWSDRHYMFTKNFRRGGEVLDSDTQNIADEWLLPYWFWGALIFVFSLVIMAWAFYAAWVRPLLADDADDSLVSLQS